ncbi:MAG: UPF0149 family protein, partial [Caldimonas sp.]
MSLFSSAPPSRGAVAAGDLDLGEAEFRELDELLASVPEPLEPLDVVMLDGFLCGVIVQPRLVDAAEWLPFVFDAGGHRWGEAEPSAEQRRARELILRRHSALNRSIAEFGAFDPYVLESVPEEGDGAAPVDPVRDALSPWISGFAQALQLLPGLGALGDPEVDSVLSELVRFLPDDASVETAPSVPASGSAPSLDAAIGALVAEIANLYDVTAPLRYKVDTLRRDAPKVGRNDPCPCGSGRKFKQCH